MIENRIRINRGSIEDLWRLLRSDKRFTKFLCKNLSINKRKLFYELRFIRSLWFCDDTSGISYNVADQIFHYWKNVKQSISDDGNFQKGTGFVTIIEIQCIFNWIRFYQVMLAFDEIPDYEDLPAKKGEFNQSVRESVENGREAARRKYYEELIDKELTVGWNHDE